MHLPNPDWPYVCYTSYDWPEVCAWCEATVGVFDQDWYKLGEDIAAQSIMSDYKSTYLFRQEQHAVLFELKWSR
jgi:hypothetical protein